MEVDLDFKTIVAKTAPTTVCSRCGAKPTLVRRLLDPRKRQVSDDPEVQVWERNLAGRHLRAKLCNSSLGDLFGVMCASGIYLDDLAGHDLANGSFRSIKPRTLMANAKARFSRSASSGLNLPSFSSRSIGISAPAHQDVTMGTTFSD